MNRWYVTHTHPKAEGQALRHLTRQGFAAYLPLYRKRRSHARRIEMVKAPLFPSYLFVRMDVGRVRWRAIRSTIGVRHLICNGDMPAPVPQGVVEELRAREDENGLFPLRPPPPFEPGETVRVGQGTLRDQVGQFEGVADQDRVVILLNMLGRPFRVTLPLEAVEAFA